MELIDAKTIMSGYSDGSHWFGNNYNMNIYKGCCHGCIYCDSRSECYRVEDFDRVRAKRDALALIARELRSKRRRGVVGTGAMSDPYNPYESEHRLTRGALELIDAAGFGASIVTKSDLVIRDIDVLSAIAGHSPALVCITITTTDDSLCGLLEPHAPSATRRLAALKELSSHGICAGILMMPLLPFIEDNPDNVVSIVRVAAEAGARFVFPSFGVTLRQNQRKWFFDRLDERFPALRQRYVSQFGDAYHCPSPAARQLSKVFTAECNRLGIMHRMPEIIEASRRPYTRVQLSLFDSGPGAR
jgi:DNA repair photolyase